MNNALQQFIIRFLIIMFWLISIGLFLYLPNFIHEKRSINILAQPSVIDAEYLQDFEKETGIKVHISYFESSDELIVKLRGTKGKGYDLIMPPVYAAEILIKEGLLKKINHSRLNFYDQIYPALLGKYFDPQNEYTIPIFWAIYGIGIDKNYWYGEEPPHTWGLLFDKKLTPECVIMADDPRTLALVAAQYLFGTIENITADKMQKITQLLLKQKPWVHMYNDLRVEFLISSQVCPVGMVASSDLAKMLFVYKNIEFIIPKEGGFAWVDSLAIPVGSTKEDLIYPFLNYLYQPDIFKKYVDKYKFFSPVKNVMPSGKLTNLSVPTEKMFEKLEFFKNVIDEQLLTKLFIKLKS